MNLRNNNTLLGYKTYFLSKVGEIIMWFTFTSSISDILLHSHSQCLSVYWRQIFQRERKTLWEENSSWYNSTKWTSRTIESNYCCSQAAQIACQDIEGELGQNETQSLNLVGAQTLQLNWVNVTNCWKLLLYHAEAAHIAYQDTEDKLVGMRMRLRKNWCI